jgi:YbbR domain-containing protein
VENVIVTGIKLNQDSLMIMGSKSVLDKVDEIKLPTGDIAIETGQSDIVKEYEVEDLLPEGVYLNEDIQTLVLTVLLEEKMQRTISINVADIGLMNIPDGMDASIVSNGSLNFSIEGMQEDVENLDMSKVLAYVSLKNVSEGISQVAVELQLPDGVTRIGDNYVSVSLTSTESKTTTVGNAESTTVQPSTTEQMSETSSGNEQDTDSRSEETTTAENVTVQGTT